MAVYVFLLLVIGVVVGWNLQGSSGTSGRDASLVYCLAPGHAGGLVNAAVTLSLAGQGSTASALLVNGRKLSLDQWRAADSADFQRACDAFAAANMPSPPAQAAPGGELGTVAGVLLPVVAGALLTMAADDFKQAADRRWEQADEMRADWRAFQAAAGQFVEDCVTPLRAGLPATGDLAEKRRKLRQTLRKIRAGHRFFSRIAELSDSLDGDVLGSSLETGWDIGNTAKAERAREVRNSLTTFGENLEQAATALARKIWLMR